MGFDARVPHLAAASGECKGQRSVDAAVSDTDTDDPYGVTLGKQRR